jgi:UDP-N-acetylmuramoyl-tripeptide--D-alanyl-D-alanine ligase
LKEDTVVTASLWHLHEILTAVAGQWLGACTPEIFGVNLDDRAIKTGDLFVAIKRQRDGHDFVASALDQGAAAAIVSKIPVNLEAPAPLILVPDTMAALVALAGAARRRFRGKVIAVTGSVGKTTTKEMLRQMLGVAGQAYASGGNLNNAIGVPLSLARLPRNWQFGIFELGMNHAGEIRALSRMVMPDAALITNVEPVHLENFASIHAIGLPRQKFLRA